MPEYAGIREFVRSLAREFHEFPVADATRESVDGPLDWPGYGDQRARARDRTGLEESVLCGRAELDGSSGAVVIAFEFDFLGGSVGQATGDRIVDAFERARTLHLPVVSVVSSGGSRMQEGMCALHQLQRVAEQAVLTRRVGLGHITVLRGPVTGGMWASLSAGADMIYAVPGSQVCFAGSRIRHGGKPPSHPEAEEAFTAEGKAASGQVDRILESEDLPATVAAAVRLLDPDRHGGDAAEVPRTPPGAGTAELPATGWEAVCRARDPHRPHAEAYLEDHFDARVALSGDRCGGVDPGMLCGLGERDGRVIAYAAQTGTANTPAGFRTAARLIRLAGHLGVPVLTLVDTPGAAHDAEAERAGVGPAIAAVFTEVAAARIPVTTLVVGEGGSGGALALAAPQRTWTARDAYFAVTAPESGAAILKYDSDGVSQLADRLRVRPQDLVELGLVRGILGAR